MSVPPVAAPSETAGATSAPPDQSVTTAARGDFAAALAAATSATSGASGSGPDGELRSVPLGEMVAAYASSPALGAPASTGPPAQAGPALGGAAPVEAATAGVRLAAGSGAGAQVLQAGERYLGVPYQWGGTDPQTGFDCSGFVQQAFADIGVNLPRVSVDQARQGTEVASMAQARPGDLVFWNGDGSRPNHIGIYAGEGRMLVAPSTGDVVRYQEITREPHAIRRVV